MRAYSRKRDSGMAATNTRRTGLFTLALFLIAGVAPGGGADLRLVDAAANQNSQAVRALLGEGVDVNTPRADGVTALLWAAHWDDLETVELLLGAGADVNPADDHGVTPLMRASENASVEVVRVLLTAGGNANAAETSGLTPLMIAARTGNRDVVWALLTHGAGCGCGDAQLGCHGADVGRSRRPIPTSCMCCLSVPPTFMSRRQKGSPRCCSPQKTAISS